MSLILVIQLTSCDGLKHNTIDRENVVRRHNIITTMSNPKSPSQAGNGEFAFGFDITGLQTFVPFNTLSQWSWHSFPPPPGILKEDFKGVPLSADGRMINFFLPDKDHPELSEWLAGSPHRFNLGRLGLVLIKSDGSVATEADLKNCRQETDLWDGLTSSSFELEGEIVRVITACHPSSDALGFSVTSDLVRKGQIKILIDFPYADSKNMTMYIGDYSRPDAHASTVRIIKDNSVEIERKMDDAEYYVALSWTTDARFLAGDTITSPHRFYLDPSETDKLEFSCTFLKQESQKVFHSAKDIFDESKKGWQEFWKSGAAIDLSQSKDPRWKELERRIILSQYLMKINEAGSFPPQEAGLVNNGWYGRFHFEMIWWHGVHYALWDRWDLLDRSLHVYHDFLPTSVQRAKDQGYHGARWPKCTADFDRDWPHEIHALLIWQQPHPIYFAELDYRLHPGKETLEKWSEIVFQTAEFMADYAFYDKTSDRYILGPPVHIMSENANPVTTFNPAFELGYWRYGLKTAQVWKQRMGLERDPGWDDVLNKLPQLPVEDGLYITHEDIDSMWTKFTFEHPGLTGTFGMLPGDGVDTAVFKATLEKVIRTWNFNRTWGWDFPMIAMAAARAGNPDLAVEMLLHSSPGFQFDEHGLATGGPFPYFPSNGALLTAVAMMAGGWDGSTGITPGFPKNGNWKVKAEGFKRLP